MEGDASLALATIVRNAPPPLSIVATPGLNCSAELRPDRPGRARPPAVMAAVAKGDVNVEFVAVNSRESCLVWALTGWCPLARDPR